MGIKGLSKFLKDKYPVVYSQVHLSNFAGRKIAIDANNWMYVNMFLATRKTANNTDFKSTDINRSEIVKNWLESCIRFAINWLENKVIPIFVFDGEYPEEKSNTQGDRREKKAQLREEIIQLKNNLIDPEDEIRLKSLVSRDSFITSSETAVVQSVLKNLGIPVIIAPGEAEKFCSYMTLRGRADLVFTTDSDALCFGAKMIINKVTNFQDAMVQVIILKEVLTHLKLTQSELIDLCIMAGCDYNSNIDKIGIVKSYALLKKHGNIESIAREGVEKGKAIDVTCLKHEVCRRLFEHDYSIDFNSEDLVLRPEILAQHGRDTLNSFDLAGHMTRLSKCMSPELMPVSLTELMRQSKFDKSVANIGVGK